MGAPQTATGTRDALLASAARVFARVGFRAATVQTIAGEAGFTPPTLYAHFGSKKGLFEGLVEVLTTELFAALGRTLPEGLSLAQRLELRVRDVLDLAERQRDLFSLFIVRPYDLPDLEPGRDDHALLQAHWVQLFEKHAEELGDRTPVEAALMLEGMLYAWVGAWLRSGSSEPGISESTRRVVDLVLHGLTGDR